MNVIRPRTFPVLLFAAHAPLGIILYQAPVLGLVHAYATLGVGLYFALAMKPLGRVAAVAAYICGVEVLWRMAQAPVFWEFGKYAAALVMVVALVRRGLVAIPPPAALYFALLLPSCFIAMTEFTAADFKDKLSFNMSGPLLILVSCWFFSHLRVSWPRLRGLLLTFAAPLFAVAVTTLFYTVTTPDITFTNESNFATSGGFGPNQVSSMLGFGVFMIAAAYLLFPNSFRDRVVLGALAVLFAAQSVLTFSRGGMYNAVGAIAALVAVLAVGGRGLGKIVPIAAVGLIFLLGVFPLLDRFTGGNLGQRFEDTDPTHRVDIVRSDIEIFRDNPIFGVGVGRSYALREQILEYKAASHTEFSRVVSEHGTLGLLSLLMLVIIAVQNFLRQRTWEGKALVTGCVVWATLFMLNAGMRLAAPSIVWGVVFATVVRRFGNSDLGFRMSRSPAPKSPIYALPSSNQDR